MQTIYRSSPGYIVVVKSHWWTFTTAGNSLKVGGTTKFSEHGTKDISIVGSIRSMTRIDSEFE